MPTVSSATSSSTSTTGQSSTTSSNSTSTIDYESFLKLLTAQLSYQDPTKPQDPSAFVSQLASFSSVEQGIRTNTKLDSLITSLALSQGEGTIGRTVTSSDGSITGQVASVRIVSDGAVAVLTDGQEVSLEAGIRIAP